MIVVGTTTAPWKTGKAEELLWLENAEGMIQDAAGMGHELKFFAALETDVRGLLPVYQDLFDRSNKVMQLGAAFRFNTEFDFWSFSLNDHATEVTSGGRLIRICTGRNLIREYAMRAGASHILYVDSDLVFPNDTISKLLEIDHPVVGGNVPLYCLDGPKVEQYPDKDVREHWNTAGFLLVRREVFTKIAWRYDLDEGMTDDPSFQHDTQLWGFGQTWVRHDVIGSSPDQYIVAVEHRNVDKKIYR